MTIPLPETTLITIKVSAGTALFQARGRVVYSDRNAGSGVEFQDVEPHYQAVLKEWLMEAQEINKIEE